VANIIYYIEDRKIWKEILTISTQIGKDQKIGVGRQIGILPTGKNGDMSQE
jgi:hypothetical protein